MPEPEIPLIPPCQLRLAGQTSPPVLTLALYSFSEEQAAKTPAHRAAHEAPILIGPLRNHKIHVGIPQPPQNVLMVSRALSLPCHKSWHEIGPRAQRTGSCNITVSTHEHY